MERGTGSGVGQTMKSDWRPLHPHIRVGVLMLPMRRAYKGLVNNHDICDATIWTPHGTEVFLGRCNATGGLDMQLIQCP